MGQDHYSILPYNTVDGNWNVSDEFMESLYNRLCIEGKESSVFYDGSIKNKEEFINYFKSSGVVLYLVLSKVDIVGMAWLTSFDQRTAQVHFSAFNGAGKGVVRAGTFTINKLVNLKDSNGYLFDSLYGIMSMNNEVGRKYVKKCGMVGVGVIPNFCFNYWTQRSEDGEILYINRRDL